VTRAREAATVRAEESPSLAVNRTSWEDLARLDPLWAILSDPAHQHGKWDPDAFFATGVREIDALLTSAARHDRPRRFGRALDFGCGVGRLTSALAAHFDEAVGVDISAAMIEQARTYLRDRPNCRFLVNDAADLLLFPDGHFDVIYSNIALQHVPRREHIRRYLAEFVRVLAADGIAVFQLPSALRLRNRIQLRPRLYHALRRAGAGPRWLYETLHLHPVTMNFLPEDDVIATVRSAGGAVIDVQRRRASSTISCLYFVSRAPAAR
jgi:SAM-dependent methyltransferase